MTQMNQSVTDKKYLISYQNHNDCRIRHTHLILFSENEIERVVALLEFAGILNVVTIEVLQ